MDKPALRNTLKKLRALPLEGAVHAHLMMAPQEMLDFLAMLAGMKPVCIVGCGFNHRPWVEGVVALARKMDLNVIEGPMWDAEPEDDTLPQWFREHIDAAGPDDPVFYVCRARGTAEAVQAAIDAPPISMEEEARLTGYPECCVKAHYERQLMFNQVFYRLLQRTGGGNLEEMQRILREDIAMGPETPEEEAAMKEAMEFLPAPFTSFHMCAACAADPTRPGQQLSKKYEALAREINGELAAQIAASQQGVGRY